MIRSLLLGYYDKDGLRYAQRKPHEVFAVESVVTWLRVYRSVNTSAPPHGAVAWRRHVYLAARSPAA